MANADQLPRWDDERAEILVGKRVLVGITTLEADGETLVDHVQYYGVITSAHPTGGFRIDCSGILTGAERFLPPDLRGFSDAFPGEYTLRSTGEVVVNPDVLCTWNVIKPKN
ncbi:hypothetical protein [Hyphomicrobium sp.]|uniref:hypothetical protein n=1 Tax=Hyphomicrobium sp. TaxID=82 RepID=UPI001DF1CE66|nr:hypothetical protein [Hyphomicrobium sp.]MBY0560616.1 hypothetical protein [Hyphomicrobium sp.]